MDNNIIYVDFTKNKRKNNKLTFLSRIKGLIRRLLNYDDPSNSKNNKKIIYYSRDIS